MLLIYLITAIVSAASIVYELLLGTALSAFLGNTVLRYSITIGLYMASLGVGAYLAERPSGRDVFTRFLSVECVLALTGGLCVMLFFFADYLVGSHLLFLLFGHAVVIAIGVVSGYELPLLLAIAERAYGPQQVGPVLGSSYFGATAGTLLFAFYLYPSVGLVSAGLLVGGLNALVGLIFALYFVRSFGSVGYRRAGAALGLLLLSFIICLIWSEELSAFLLKLYLSPLTCFLPGAL